MDVTLRNLRRCSSPEGEEPVPAKVSALLHQHPKSLLVTVTTPSKELHVIPPLYKTLFQPTKVEHIHTEVRQGWGGEWLPLGLDNVEFILL